MSSFYKYVTPERLDVLAHQTLRFTQARALNDPFELKPYFEQIFARDYLSAAIDAEPIDLVPYLKEEYRRLPDTQRKQISQTKFLKLAEAHRRAEPEEYARIVAEVKAMMLDTVQGLAQWARDELYGKAGQLVGILSLSETADNGLMWSHYADEHKGFVVEFDGSSSFVDQRRSADDDHYKLRPVLYPIKRPRYKDLLQLDRNSLYLTKGHEWRYEREHRMTIPLALHPPINPAAVEPIHLLHFPSAALRRVVLGTRASRETEESIAHLLQSEQALEHVELVRAVLDDESGTIRIVPVNSQEHD